MKYVAMAGNYILMMFYTSVCGWLFYYFYKMLMGDFNGLNVDQINNEFGLMLSNPLVQVGMMFLVVCIGFSFVQKACRMVWKSIKVYDVVFIGVDACASCSFTHFARGYGGRKVLLVA